MDRLTLLARLLWVRLHTRSYIEFTDTGTAAFFIEYGNNTINRMRVG